ncbi:MAG TPA: class I SAM-dependent methyltransferase, partial [Verrucomicrobiae bacterium]|nr:class I SAM-dependent methyltransferase [Verrucomicrobiae bacterium]
MTEVDFGKSANDYASHRKGFPASMMTRLAELQVGLPGQSLLDLGTGTGLLGLEMARRGCEVIGLDPSEALLEKAREAARRDGLSARFVRGVAEETGFASDSFDVVVAGTAWHWFDKSKAAREARRILKPDGRLAITVLEWHFLPNNVLTETLKLIRKFAPRTSRPHPSALRYPEWTKDLVSAGFDRWEAFAYIEPLAYTHDGWRGRVRASQGAGPVMDSRTLGAFDEAMVEMLSDKFPDDPMTVDHRVSAIV